MSIEMRVKGVALDPEREAPVVLLSDVSGTFSLPIYIGVVEATAIAMHLDGVQVGRPLTHDLMKNLLEALGARLERVEVCDLKEGTYYATLHLAVDGQSLRVDARPSDGIALAVRCGAPISVDETVIDESNVLLEDTDPEGNA